MKATVFALLAFGVAGQLNAQTPQPPPSVTQVDALARKSIPLVIPRKERPTLMEALIQKDKRIVAAIRQFDLKSR